MIVPRILIVDDEAALRDSLSYAFAKEGFDVATAADAAAGIESVRKCRADVIVLDLILPDRDGMDVCRDIRRESEIPIIMLSARDQITDRLQGFEVGADDYVTKPFNTRELVARVHSVLDRERKARSLLAADQLLLDQMNRIIAEKTVLLTSPTSPSVSFAGLALDPITSDVLIDGRRVAISGAEFRLLEVLLAERGRVATRTELSRRIWGASNEETTVFLEAVVRTVCQKVEVDPSRPRRLVTVPGIGYRLS
ncbi:MAG TPA: response regulator transcription factor [Polyangia bacterium]|jgi:two-component system response regulator RegX3|nr:response regulator transcription factor [Polyangia bacterium]